MDPVIRDKDSELGRPTCMTQCVVDPATGIRKLWGFNECYPVPAFHQSINCGLSVALPDAPLFTQ